MPERWDDVAPTGWLESGSAHADGARHLTLVPELPATAGRLENVPDDLAVISVAEAYRIDWDDGGEPSPELSAMIDVIDTKFAGLTMAERQRLLRRARFGLDGTIYWGPEPV